MEPDATIPPFVFVEGRKYVLADPAELPEPEIFERLTPPPRNVSPSVRWRLLLRQESYLFVIALCMGICCTLGMMLVLGNDVGFMMAIALPMLPLLVTYVPRIYSGIRETSGIIRLLQDGFVGKGRFFGMCSTGKKIDNLAEIQL